MDERPLLFIVEDDEPLRQRMALTRHASEGAERFYDYLQQPAARAVFERYGFSLPTR